MVYWKSMKTAKVSPLNIHYSSMVWKYVTIFCDSKCTILVYIFVYVQWTFVRWNSLHQFSGNSSIANYDDTTCLWQLCLKILYKYITIIIIANILWVAELKISNWSLSAIYYIEITHCHWLPYSKYTVSTKLDFAQSCAEKLASDRLLFWALSFFYGSDDTL